jgi:hypothetical protein
MKEQEMRAAALEWGVLPAVWSLRLPGEPSQVAGARSQGSPSPVPPPR